MQMCRQRGDLPAEFIEIVAKMITGQGAMGYVEAHAQIKFLAPMNDFLDLDEQVLISLATEMPRKRSHRLRNQLDTV